MKEELDEKSPTASEMNLPEEYVYAIRIINILKNVNLNKKCDEDEAIRAIAKTFIEFKNKITLYK